MFELLKRFFSVLPFTVLISVIGFAQSDSMVLVNASWQVDTLDGVVLKRVHFQHKEYFQSNQYIAFLEIQPNSGLQLELACEPTRTKTSTIAQKHNALAAINGSFFDMDRHFPVCYLRIDSVELGENTPGKDTLNRKYYQYGTLLVNGDSVRIERTDSARTWERCLPDRNIMTAGPLLIYHGEEQSIRQDRTFVTNRHNRTAVGIRPDGTILLLVVDGRTKQSEGMTLGELTRTLQWLGCTEALNMDGGGSTTLYIHSQPNNGIINHPSDNGCFDHSGERGVSNIIMVKRDF